MPRKRKLLLVAGARPNFMKIAPVLRALERRRDRFAHVLVHTGQHYDDGMSEIFFRELRIPAPDYHLGVGGGSHAEQTAAIMTRFEPVLARERPDCVVVFGDVNSTLACAIVAKKAGVRVAHVEAGLRSGDMTMPEEVNRVVTDSVADDLFVTEESALEHLRREGKPASSVFHVGNVMIDNLLHEVARLGRVDPATLASSGLKSAHEDYGVVTLHRPSNVDHESTFRGITDALAEISVELRLIFPVHPRTRASMDRFGIRLPPRVRLTEPLGYLDFLNLWRDARLVLTDSGGLQEETTALGVPCLTLRENTERPVTVTHGTNRVVGVEASAIVAAARERLRGGRTRGAPERPRLWDGKASERILDVLEERLAPDRSGG